MQCSDLPNIVKGSYMLSISLLFLEIRSACPSSFQLAGLYGRSSWIKNGFSLCCFLTGTWSAVRGRAVRAIQ